MRKTILAAALATAMVSSLATTAFAAETNTTEGSTELKYSVTEGYTWTVPAVIDFGKDGGVSSNSVNGTAKDATGENTAESKVKVTKNIIGDGQKLVIKISESQSAFTIANGKTTLTYKVTADSKELSAGSEIMSVDAGTNTGEKELTFTLTTTDGTAEVAGNYTGKLAYTSSLEKKS